MAALTWRETCNKYQHWFRGEPGGSDGGSQVISNAAKAMDFGGGVPSADHRPLDRLDLVCLAARIVWRSELTPLPMFSNCRGNCRSRHPSETQSGRKETPASERFVGGRSALRSDDGRKMMWIVWIMGTLVGLCLILSLLNTPRPGR
jgi:hypothetical protein